MSGVETIDQDTLVARYNRQAEELSDLRAKLEAAERDGRRLDWLDAQATIGAGGWVARNSTTGRGFRLHQTGGAGSESVREAIDAALASAPAKEAGPAPSDLGGRVERTCNAAAPWKHDHHHACVLIEGHGGQHVDALGARFGDAPTPQPERLTCACCGSQFSPGDTGCRGDYSEAHEGQPGREEQTEMQELVIIYKPCACTFSDHGPVGQCGYHAQLKRDLEAAQRERDEAREEWAEHVKGYKLTISQLEAQLTAAREDGERLDWLGVSDREIHVTDMGDGDWFVVGKLEKDGTHSVLSKHKSIRAAVDAARASAEGGTGND